MSQFHPIHNATKCGADENTDINTTVSLDLNKYILEIHAIQFMDLV